MAAAAFSTTDMATFQLLLARSCTGWVFLLCFVKTEILLTVAALQLKVNLYFAGCSAGISTNCITWMTALQCFGAGLLTHKCGWILVAGNHLFVLTLGYGLLHLYFAIATCLIAQFSATMS